MSIRLLVTGGRDFDDAAFVDKVLDAVQRKRGVSVLIHGDCRGADRLAAQWAERNGIEMMAFPANWAAHRAAAGPIRNAQMVEQGKPDAVVAFPGGYGTHDMTLRARDAGLPIWQPRYR